MPEAVRNIPTLRCYFRLAGFVLAVTAAGLSGANAADQIKVGKASATTFAFAPIEIGKELGLKDPFETNAPVHLRYSTDLKQMPQAAE